MTVTLFRWKKGKKLKMNALITLTLLHMYLIKDTKIYIHLISDLKRLVFCVHTDVGGKKTDLCHFNTVNLSRFSTS